MASPNQTVSVITAINPSSLWSQPLLFNSSAPCSIKSVLAHTVIPKEAHQQGKSVSILQRTVQLSVQPHRPDTTVIMEWK